jgi:hypothetical protein
MLRRTAPVIVRCALVGVMLVTVVSTTPVRAAELPVCGFDADTGLVQVVLPVQTSSFDSVVIARLGDAIAVDGELCGEATVTNTDSISVTGMPEPETSGHQLDIDLSGGPFAPGRTDEGDGSSEIEMTVDTGPSAGDVVTIVGGSRPDAISVRGTAANLDAAPDAEPDLRLLELSDFGCGDTSFCWFDALKVRSGGGADRLILRNPGELLGSTSVDAGEGPDSVVTDDSVVEGRDGDDVMRNLDTARFSGGRGDDRLVGAPASTYSFFYGASGRDVLIGGGGDDWLTGGGNDDILEGRGGLDRLYGELGQDRLTGDAGPDMLYGGPALDRCDVDPADTRVVSCNRPLNAG